MSFELFVATRYLRAKRRQAVISIITVISIIGVTAGVASLIIALAINNGFRKDLQDRLLGSTSHVNLMRVENDGIRDWPQLLDRIEKMPHIVAASPALYEQVLISRGARASGAMLKGIVPSRERRVSELLQDVKLGSVQPLIDAQQRATQPEPQGPEANNPSSLEGAQERFQSLPPIILGKDMADNLGATIGSVVTVISPQGDLTPFGLTPKYKRFKVVGILESGFYDYDAQWGLISLADAQRLFSEGDLVSVIECKVDDIYKAREIGDAVAKAAGKGFESSNWMDMNKPLFHALRLERVVTFITIGLIVFVAALNILISLIMMVMEKTKDIAVLVSMGAKPAQIRRIFMLQGILIGVVGTVLGLILGYAVSFTLGHFHLISLSAEVYSIDYVPFAPRVSDGILVAFVALFVSFIATLYPARAASRVYPAEALRYE
ncbi:MAG TPA: FtsX-like permease family protein [Terriglobales bacterium]|nr:FtsX-like permease family protein [Terriglobales bacterium]